MLFRELPPGSLRLEGFVSSDHKDLTPAQLDSAKYEINDDNFQEQHAKLAIARGKGGVGRCSWPDAWK